MIAERIRMPLAMKGNDHPPSPPPGWYPNPSGAPGQRYWDGHKWTDVPPPPIVPPRARSNTSPLKVLAIIGAVVFALVGGCAACAALIGHDISSDLSSTTTTTTTTRSSEVPPSTVAAPPPGIGQEVRDGKFAFTVISVGRAQTVSDEFETRTAQGVYVKVVVTIRNTSNKPWSFSGSDQRLNDSAGREFEAGFGMFGGGFHDGDDINPGNQVNAALYFDVPPDAQPTLIVLHDSAFSRGAKVGLAQ